MASYTIGQGVVVTAAFTVGVTPTDPTTLTLSIEDADGDVTIYTYGVGGTIVRDSAGVFHATLSPAEIGTWRYRWVGTGAAASAIEGDFEITSTFLPSPAPTARTSMRGIIAAFRTAIGDVGTTHVFTDLELQAFLDERASAVGATALLADPVRTGSPVVFRAPYGWWEGAASLTNSSGGALTADGALTDAVLGTWAFATAPSGDVYITGRYFDFWGSAANALESWAAKVALEFDFATDQQSFSRSQKREGLLMVAREFGRRARQPARTGTW